MVKGISGDQPVCKLPNKKPNAFDDEVLRKAVFGNTFLNKAAFEENIFSNNNKKIPPKPANVYVVDVFSHKTVDLDGDKIPDVTHGEVTNAIVKNGEKNIKTNLINCASPDSPGYYDYPKLLTELKAIEAKIIGGEKIDGVNLSLSFNMEYDKINSLNNSPIKTKITPENLEQNIDLIKEALKKSTNKDYTITIKTIEAIEKITEKNVPVFIAAGNDKDCFNLLGLAKGSNVVGGTYKNMRCSLYSQNSTVDAWEDAIYLVNPIVSKDKKLLGYDVTNDGKPDFVPSQITANDEIKKNVGDVHIGGTSIASPAYFHKYLKAR